MIRRGCDCSRQGNAGRTVCQSLACLTTPSRHICHPSCSALESHEVRHDCFAESLTQFPGPGFCSCARRGGARELSTPQFPPPLPRRSKMPSATLGKAEGQRPQQALQLAGIQVPERLPGTMRYKPHLACTQPRSPTLVHTKQTRRKYGLYIHENFRSS